MRPLLSDEMFDQEFAPQQAARVVRNAAQPLFLRELAFAERGIGRGSLARLRLGQCGGGIAAGLGCVVRRLLLAIRACAPTIGRRPWGGGLSGWLLTGLGLALLWLARTGRFGLGAACLALGRLARLRRIV